MTASDNHFFPCIFQRCINVNINLTQGTCGEARQHTVCIYLTYGIVYFTRLYYFSIFIIVGHETLKCSHCTHAQTQAHPTWSCGLSWSITIFRTLFPSRPTDYSLLHRLKWQNKTRQEEILRRHTTYWLNDDSGKDLNITLCLACTSMWSCLEIWEYSKNMQRTETAASVYTSCRLDSKWIDHNSHIVQTHHGRRGVIGSRVPISYGMCFCHLCLYGP